MFELLNTPIQYTVDISNKKIWLHKKEDYEVLTFSNIDRFIDTLTDVRKTNNTIWYVIPPGLIDPPKKCLEVEE